MKIKLFLVLLLTWQTIFPQSVNKATEEYFRHNPFKTEFDQFLNKLISDPVLLEKDIKKKTDSTLFYVQGVYKSFSPFFFPANHCKIILSEQQEYTDSLQMEVYTYFVYQLIGYATPGKEGLNDIKEEFEKLNRRFRKGLDVSEQKELKRENEQSGIIVNYTYKDMIFYPLTIAWATTPGNKENIIALTIRFFMLDNKAYLPVPAYSP
ncbi:MAG: hypothetical protein IPN56_10370 [Chitinophagaceae bacterium]|nr:hypothetical protein [Chitinophagaceae bacterium]